MSMITDIIKNQMGLDLSLHLKWTFNVDLRERNHKIMANINKFTQYNSKCKIFITNKRLKGKTFSILQILPE